MSRSAAALATPAPDPAPTIPSNMSFSAVVAAMREAERCPVCGKTRAVLNIGGYRKAFRAERVSPATHCPCAPDGPAYVPPPVAPIDLDALVVAVLDGAVGDRPKASMETMDGACDAVEEAVAAHIGRPLADGERAKVYIATGSEFNRRRAASPDGAR